MEVLAAVALVGALAIPGWLFERAPVWAGSLATLVLFFCAGFFNSLWDAPHATARAVVWGTAAGALGGPGFYVARRLQVWERRHPVDPERWSPARQRIRRVGVPLAWLSLVWILGGGAAVIFDLVSVAVWVSVGAASCVLCGALWILFVRSR